MRTAKHYGQNSSEAKFLERFNDALVKDAANTQNSEFEKQMQTEFRKSCPNPFRYA